MYTISAGNPQTVVLTAASNAAAASATAVLTGTSGALTHTANLNVQVTATPPPPDFSLGLNPPSLSIPPGGSAQTTLSVTALNGFSSSVSVQLSGLPAGVSAPSTSYTISAGNPQTVTLSAASDSEATTSTAVFTGTSAALTHTANLGLQVEARPFPDDWFMRLPAGANGWPTLAGAYDQALKEVFFSDPNFNSVEVYSTVDGRKVGEIAIPGPAGLEFSPDFAKLYVGTITPYVYVIDPVALHVEQQIVVPPPSITSPLGYTEMPVMAYPMADGTVMLGLGVTLESAPVASLVGVYDLVRYDPVANTFTPADPGPSDLASNPARSQDGKFLFVYGFGSAAGYGLMIYSTATQSYLPAFGQVQNEAVLMAANQNGSQYATVQEIAPNGTGTAQINFWGANLQPQPQSYTMNSTVSAVIYSRDGKYLYLPTATGYIVVLDTQAGTPVGYVGLSLTESLLDSTIFDVDENYHLYGGATGGAYLLNASQTEATPPTSVPDFVNAIADANPNVGPLGGGTPVQFIPAPAGAGSGDGIAGSMEAYFGSVPAAQDTVGPYPSSSNGQNFLTAASPAATTPGPVSVLLTDANNNVIFLPDAFTYGPKILRVQPSAAGPEGGDSITIYAYGLGFFDLSDIHVTIGGAAVDMKNATLNSYASNTYPEDALTIPVPPGTPGWADVQLTTSNGSDTLKQGLQYLNAETSVAGGPFSFAVYDPARDLFYLTGNGNTVSVFNASTQVMGQPLTSSSISAGAALGQEAITPDSSKLLVVDPTDQAIIVFDLTAATSSKVSVTLASDPANTLVQPVNVVTTANNKAFVGVTPCLPLRQIDLTDMTLQGRTDLPSTCALAYTPYPEYGAASTDGSTILYAGSSGSEFGVQPSGPEYVWSYSAATDAFSGPAIFNDMPWLNAIPVVDGDGGVLGLTQGILDARRLPAVPIGTPGAIAQLNGTGSLFYGVGFEGSQIVLSDTRNGRNLLMLQAQNTQGTVIGGYQPLAMDPTGTQVLLALQSGLTYFRVAVLPLAVGTVTPETASAGGTVQVRGSGFVAGTAVTIGGKNANCSFVDAQTLSCTVPTLSSGTAAMSLSNPDGQTYSFENAIVVQ